ncbi:ATP-binding cassette domain-containing protein [Falsiroseomonas selenitidurans]|uniref:ATP-binding cassette domain-containing protein n=1 Tax=Falsiroseomonas selenitidurans TaxID=2716335 RepID=A0ABX1DWR5_9PROT|nr:ATP-binding cassette domain-containing protein [Falsiroseomonas selenitidurans]NKC29345.1 ATP-binding cassette domain-containing protein [Falsiroseomonas selenitidurans]
MSRAQHRAGLRPAPDQASPGRLQAMMAALRRAPRFRGVLGLTLAMSVARQAALLGMPLLTMHIFDGVTEGHNLDTLMVLSFTFVVALCMAGALRALRAALMAALAEDIARRLSLEALQAAVRSALLGSRRPGLAALQDTAELRRFLGGNTLADLFDMTAVPVALVVLLLLHPVYALVVGAACAMMGLLGVVLDRTTRGLVRGASEKQLKNAGELQGRLRQSDMLEGLGMLAAVVRRWEPAQAGALAEGDRAQARARAVRGVTEFASYMAQGAVVVVGVVLALGNQASPGSIIAAMMLAGTATQPIARIVLAWREWAYASLAWQRLQELFADHAAPAPQAADPAGPPGLWLQAVRWAPPGAAQPVLADVTLYCPPGTVTLVVGPNGAGKSSLLRLALGLMAAEGGGVLLDGQDTRRVDRAALGPRIGFLPQDVQLLDGTVLQNIGRFGPEDAAGVVDAARMAGAHEMIGRLPQGYATEAGPTGGLSMGQRRMVGLARALYGSPALLALDEPEAGLDQAGREAVRAAVMAAREGGAACLLVSHEPALWAGHVDQVLRLAPGGHWSAEAPGEIAA